MSTPARPSPPDECPLDIYLKIMAGAWVPKIIWYLRYGPRYFGELRRDLGAISSKVLTQKLRALEVEGLVVRRVTDASLTQVEYSLSSRGRVFDPLFETMTQVAAELARLDAAEAASGTRHKRA